MTIANHEVNVPSEGKQHLEYVEDIIISMNRRTGKSQAHYTFMHIGLYIYNYKYPSTTINAPSIETFKDRLKAMLPGPECISAFLTSEFNTPDQR